MVFFRRASLFFLAILLTTSVFWSCGDDEEGSTPNSEDAATADPEEIATEYCEKSVQCDTLDVADLDLCIDEERLNAQREKDENPDCYDAYVDFVNCETDQLCADFHSGKCAEEQQAKIMACYRVEGFEDLSRAHCEKTAECDQFMDVEECADVEPTVEDPDEECLEAIYDQFYCVMSLECQEFTGSAGLDICEDEVEAVRSACEEEDDDEFDPDEFDDVHAEWCERYLFCTGATDDSPCTNAVRGDELNPDCGAARIEHLRCHTELGCSDFLDFDAIANNCDEEFELMESACSGSGGHGADVAPAIIASHKCSLSANCEGTHDPGECPDDESVQFYESVLHMAVCYDAISERVICESDLVMSAVGTGGDICELDFEEECTEEIELTEQLCPPGVW